MGDKNTQKIMTANETRLTVAIAEIIFSECLSFNLSQKPRFKKVLDAARTLAKFYQPTNRELIYKYLLDIIHDQNMERNLSLIKKNSDVFGLLFLGDGATISRIPLLEDNAPRRLVTICSSPCNCRGSRSRYPSR